MAISKRLRFEVLRRDNHACRYCGACAPDVILTVDHVLPTALGGGDEPGNLATACKDCNAGKAASNPDAPLVADVKADALRWGQAMREAAGLRRAQLSALKDYADGIDAIWQFYAKESGLGFRYEMPLDWEQTVEQFYVNNVSFEEWDYAISRAIRNRKVSPYKAWTYMCGIMWNRLREQMGIAEALVEQSDEET